MSFAHLDMSSTQPGSLQVAVNEQDHCIGHLNASVVLVQYGDFQCTQCLRANPILGALRIELGYRLCFVFRNFPLTRIHAYALHAAEVAELVADRTGPAGFWSMHDILFAHQLDSAEALDDAHLSRYAASVGVDPAIVERALRARTYESHVRSDFLGGHRSGVRGTPAFFINGARFRGEWTDLPTFLEAVESAARSTVDRSTARH